MGKKSLLIGAAVGYVLGARAGRKRYDQIAAAVSRLWNNPKVQSGVNQAQTTAVEGAKSAAASAKDAAAHNPTVQNTVAALKDKLPGSHSSATSGPGTTPGSQPGSTTPATPRTGSGTGKTTLPTTPPLNTPTSPSTTPRP